MKTHSDPDEGQFYDQHANDAWDGMKPSAAPLRLKEWFGNGNPAHLDELVSIIAELITDERCLWREALERALGLQSDDKNHTPEWAERLVREIREIGNRVR